MIFLSFYTTGQQSLLAHRYFAGFDQKQVNAPSTMTSVPVVKVLVSPAR